MLVGESDREIGIHSGVVGQTIGFCGLPVSSGGTRVEVEDPRLPGTRISPGPRPRRIPVAWN